MSKIEEAPIATETRVAENRNVTIHDVAKAAGVSIGTVSKAMNATGNMREETREKILAAARAIGFRRNDLAHALHRGTSRTVGIVSSDNSGRFSMPIAAGLEAQLATQQMSVFLCNATEDPEIERRHINQLLAKRVDGLIFTARRLDRRPAPKRDELGVPFLFVFSQGDGPDTLSLVPDDEQGASLAVEHLIEVGRRNIAHITGPDHFQTVHDRIRGYLKVLNAHDLGATARHMTGRWSEKWGYEATAKLFATGENRPDALFCGNDQIARGAIDCLRDLGLSVPNDVSVVGFDNWEVMAEAARPSLTSIDMNLNDLGREAGNLFLRLIGGETMTGIVRRPCRLVVRDSSIPKT